MVVVTATCGAVHKLDTSVYRGLEQNALVVFSFVLQ